MTEQQPRKSRKAAESGELGRLARDVRQIIDYVEELRARPVVPQAIAEQLAALHHETERLRRRVARLEDDERNHTHDGHSRTLLNGIYCEPHGHTPTDEMSTHSSRLASVNTTRYWLRRPGKWIALWPYGLTGGPAGPVYRLTEDKWHAARS